MLGCPPSLGAPREGGGGLGEPMETSGGFGGPVGLQGSGGRGREAPGIRGGR